MSQVLDIITKLSYEADVSVVEALNAEFGEQIKEINALNARLKNYEQQLAKTSNDEIRKRQAITLLIERQKQQIDRVTEGMGRQYAANTKLQAGLQKTAGGLQNLTFAGSQLLREAPAFTFSLQTGILALSNNIPILLDQLKSATAQGATAKQIFSALGQSIFGFTGIITIAVAALSIFGDKLFDTTTEAERQAKAIEKLDKVTADYRKEVESFRTPTFFDTQNLNNLDKGLKAQQQYVELLKSQGVTGARLVAEENKAINIRISNLLDEIKLYESRTSSIIRFDKEIYERKREISDLQNQIAVNESNLSTELTRKAKEEAKRLAELREDIARRAREINRTDFDEYLTFLQEIDKQAEESSKKVQTLLGDLAQSFTNQLSNETFKTLPDNQATSLRVQLEVQQDQKKLDEQDKRAQEKANKVRQDNINAGIDGYQMLANAAINSFNQIYDAQVEMLDREIDIRRDRVSQAIELAKRGNTEILQAEQDRLEKAERERERVAERQLQLNALLQASSAAIAVTQALQVVTNAGATGDPYTTAARIAAAVAALAAGFAFVTSITSAFKDGVIDYKGKGTGTSDSNVVRISRGESVMTAKETQEYKPWLTAMRNGTFSTVLQQRPSSDNRRSGETDKLLQELIEVNSREKTTVNASIDERGLSIMTERNIRRNKAKYKA